MDVLLREAKKSDIPFLKEMLYEAVFWRNPESRPSFDEAIVLPEVSIALEGWGEREGDAAVVAVVDSMQAGAAWYRYWTGSSNTRGYINESIPILAIGVHEDYRHRGIGKRLIEWLADHTLKQSVEKISLCVSKDNYAINLYKQQGFIEYSDIGDSVTMVRDIKNLRLP